MNFPKTEEVESRGRTERKVGKGGSEEVTVLFLNYRIFFSMAVPRTKRSALD